MTNIYKIFSPSNYESGALKKKKKTCSNRGKKLNVMRSEVVSMRKKAS